VSVQPTADGGYIVAGATNSFGAGGSDAWVLKLDASGSIIGCTLVGTSNATQANSAGMTGNRPAVVADSSATPISGTATTSSSTATPQQECYYAAPAAADIPTLSEWGLIILAALLATLGFVYVYRQT
jgi:hypothetical protein